MMANIFEIAQDMRALDDLLTESGGDISDPTAAAAVDAFMLELENNLEEKVESYLKLVKELEARAKARRDEADRIRNRSKVDTNSAAALKRRLCDALKMIDRKRIETATFKVTVGKPGGKPPIEIDPTYLDDRWLTRVVDLVPDKDAIRAALEAGAEVKGASFGPRADTLRVS